MMEIEDKAMTFENGTNLKKNVPCDEDDDDDLDDEDACCYF